MDAIAAGPRHFERGFHRLGELAVPQELTIVAPLGAERFHPLDARPALEGEVAFSLENAGGRDVGLAAAHGVVIEPLCGEDGNNQKRDHRPG